VDYIALYLEVVVLFAQFVLVVLELLYCPQIMLKLHKQRQTIMDHHMIQALAGQSKE